MTDDVLTLLKEAAARKWQGNSTAQGAGLFARAAAEIEQLRTYAEALNARCIADTPDAERYRKWRADYTNNESTDMLIELADAWNPAQVDAAIDAALAVGAA